MKRLFHLAQAEAWHARPISEPWAPASLEREGFIHLSFATQLEGTLAIHYATTTRLILLEVDRERAADALRLEPSRGGADFPHLYRALETDDICAEWSLARGPSGEWELPDDLK